MTDTSISTSCIVAPIPEGRPSLPLVARRRAHSPDHADADGLDLLQRAMLLGLDRDNEMRARFLRRRWQGVLARCS